MPHLFKHSRKSSAPSYPTLSIEEVVRLEQEARENGTPLLTLMERAGSAVARAAEKRLAPRGQVTVLTGSGNNGGDGWVAARILADKGYDVIVFAPRPADEITTEPAAKAARKASAHASFKTMLLPDESMFDIALFGADLIIDGLLGTGFSSHEVKEPYASWIRAANEAFFRRAVPILAIDCPSGLDAQTGKPAKDCICATETITMIAVKSGMVAKSAEPYVGTITLETLGIERQDLN